MVNIDKPVHFLSTRQTRGFLVIWLGQCLSMVGSGMTSFVMSIWAYRHTGSMREFSTIILAAALPSILMGPFAGLMVDRWDKRTVLAASVVGQAAATAILAFLFATQRLTSYWQVYPAVILIAVCASFQGPALTVVASRLLPQQLYSRSSGLWQLNQAAMLILSPMLAIAITPFVEISGVIYFDAVSYLFALASLWIVAIPAVAQARATAQLVRQPIRYFLEELSAGWQFVRGNSALLQLLTMQLVRNIVYGMVQILIFPLSVVNDSSVGLAILMASSAGGMVVGSFVMAVWRGPKKQISGVLWSGVIVGFALVAAGPQRTQTWLAISLFCVTVVVPLGLSCSSAIWLRKTPPALLGRVSALTSTLIQLCFPAACLIAPLLTDNIFTPLLSPGSVLSAHGVARLFGVGEHRGVGLLMSALGLFTMLTSFAFFFSPKLRHIERDLPNLNGVGISGVEAIPNAHGQSSSHAIYGGDEQPSLLESGLSQLQGDSDEQLTGAAAAIPAQRRLNAVGGTQ